MIRKGAGYQRLTPLERWLRRYLDARAEAMDAVDRVDRIDAMAEAITRRVTGMPRAPAEDVLPRLMDERRKLNTKAAAADQLRAELVAAFAALPTDERRLMNMYYIDGLTLDEVSDKLPCSRRQADYLRSYAMDRLCSGDYGVPEGVKAEMAKINEERAKATQEAKEAKAAKSASAGKRMPKEAVPVVQGVVLGGAAKAKAEQKAKALGLSMERYLETLVLLAE